MILIALFACAQTAVDRTDHVAKGVTEAACSDAFAAAPAEKECAEFVWSPDGNGLGDCYFSCLAGL